MTPQEEVIPKLKKTRKPRVYHHPSGASGRLSRNQLMEQKGWSSTFLWRLMREHGLPSGKWVDASGSSLRRLMPGKTPALASASRLGGSSMRMGPRADMPKASPECSTPSAFAFAFQLPNGITQALGLCSLGQLAEPTFDPEDPRRLLLELLTPEFCTAAPHNGEGRT